VNDGDADAGAPHCAGPVSCDDAGPSCSLADMLAKTSAACSAACNGPDTLGWRYSVNPCAGGYTELGIGVGADSGEALYYDAEGNLVAVIDVSAGPNPRCLEGPDGLVPPTCDYSHLTLISCPSADAGACATDASAE
jgi:hypothetical protein